MTERRFGVVAVLKGGVSSEREVSLRSGVAVAQGLRAGGYTVVEMDLTEPHLQLPPSVEAVFVALHGTFGEDGKIQRILAEQKVPYTGSGAESCRIAFDKVLTRERLVANGIPVPPGEVLWDSNARTIPLPLVAKPPRERSSVGCHLVFDEADWVTAFEDVRHYSADVLVEEYISGRELTVGVVEGQALPVVEIQTASDWYDFDAKYLAGDTRYTVPAELPPATTKEVQAIALKTFQCLEAEGVGRVDFRLSSSGNPYVLELNSIPGFTSTSLLPKSAEAAGIDFSRLCCKIMESARVK